MKERDLKTVLKGLKLLVNQGSIKFRYAVHRCIKKIEPHTKESDEFIKSQRSPRLVELESEKDDILKKCLTEEQAFMRVLAMPNYKELTNMVAEFNKKITDPFLDQEADISLFRYTLKPEDFEGDEKINPKTQAEFEAIEAFCDGLELMQ